MMRVRNGFIEQVMQNLLESAMVGPAEGRDITVNVEDIWES